MCRNIERVKTVNQLELGYDDDIPAKFYQVCPLFLANLGNRNRMTDTKRYFETALIEVDSVPPISNGFHKIMELTEGSEMAREELIR